MKKFILGIILVIAAGVTGVLFYADHIAQRTVETGSSRAFGTPVQVGGVRLGLMDASFDLNGYEVANPGEFETPFLFGIGSAELDVGYDGLGREKIVADRLAIDGVVLHLEMNGGRTNFGPVLSNLRGLSGGGGGESQGPRFVIRELELKGIEASLKLPGLERTVTVPPVRLENVGGEDGVWMQQLAAIVLGAVMEGAADSGKLPPELAAVLGQGLGNLPASVAREAKERIRDAVEEEAGSLLDRVTGGDSDDSKDGGDGG